MDYEVVTYIKRWQAVYDHVISTRSPDPYHDGRSVQVLRKLYRPSGFPLPIATHTGAVWACLVLNCRNLEMSPAKTRCSNERIAQACGISYRNVTDAITSLRDLGLIRTKRVYAQTNITVLFIDPLDPDDKDGPAVLTPVSVTEMLQDDLIRSQAMKEAKKKSKGISLSVTPRRGTQPIITALRTIYEDHITFSSVPRINLLVGDLGSCVDIAGSPEICHSVLNTTLHGKTPESIWEMKNCAESEDLGKHILQQFPRWFDTYQSRYGENGSIQ